MFRRKKQPRLEPYTEVSVKYEPVTPEQIEAFRKRQELWRYLNERNVSYGPGEYHNYPVDDPFYEPLRDFDRELEKADAEFQRMIDEFDKPIRELEAELARTGAPKIGDIKVEDGITYMVTSVTTKYGVRQVYDP